MVRVPLEHSIHARPIPKYLEGWDSSGLDDAPYLRVSITKLMQTSHDWTGSLVFGIYVTAHINI